MLTKVYKIPEAEEMRNLNSVRRETMFIRERLPGIGIGKST